MHRESCMACGGPTVPGEVFEFTGLYFKSKRRGSKGRRSARNPSAVGARLCVTCGHVALFVSDPAPFREDLESSELVPTAHPEDAGT
jgi:hypothetical protein